MSDKTNIAWCDSTFNPWMGCTKVSAGCVNCYAESFTQNRMGLRVWGSDPRRRTSPANWRNPRKWDRDARAAGQSRRVFCASLCDVFEEHPDVDAWRGDLWSLIRECTALDWLILTKRPERIASCLPADWDDGWPHVWLGTSVEGSWVSWRVHELARVPAAVRFVSYEPALGPIAHSIDLRAIDWLICGGESGPLYRPMAVQWARDARDVCAREGVSFFFKQSAASRPGQGVELDGEHIMEWPRPRRRVQ